MKIFLQNLFFFLLVTQICFAQWYPQNSGTTWTIQTNGTSNGLYGISFTDENNGTAVGEGGTILRTTNGGAPFVEEENLDELPTEFLLSQNYPNPFNLSTKIRYSVQ